MTALATTRAHYEAQARDALGRFMRPDRLSYLQRYFADPVFRAEQDAEREAKRERLLIEWDADEVRRNGGPDEPGYVGAYRERVTSYARQEHDYQLLIRAGISDAEARRIVGEGE